MFRAAVIARQDSTPNGAEGGPRAIPAAEMITTIGYGFG